MRFETEIRAQGWNREHRCIDHAAIPTSELLGWGGWIPPARQKPSWTALAVVFAFLLVVILIRGLTRGDKGRWLRIGAARLVARLVMVGLVLVVILLRPPVVVGAPLLVVISITHYLVRLSWLRYRDDT